VVGSTKSKTGISIAETLEAKRTPSEHEAGLILFSHSITAGPNREGLFYTSWIRNSGSEGEGLTDVHFSKERTPRDFTWPST
jgi:hypothetical protein